MTDRIVARLLMGLNAVLRRVASRLARRRPDPSTNEITEALNRVIRG